MLCVDCFMHGGVPGFAEVPPRKLTAKRSWSQCSMGNPQSALWQGLLRRRGMCRTMDYAGKTEGQLQEQGGANSSVQGRTEDFALAHNLSCCLVVCLMQLK